MQIMRVAKSLLPPDMRKWAVQQVRRGLGGRADLAKPIMGAVAMALRHSTRPTTRGAGCKVRQLGSCVLEEAWWRRRPAGSRSALGERPPVVSSYTRLAACREQIATSTRTSTHMCTHR